ncbi:DUF1996 domain-containing protein [Spirillospora sp. NPDC000708]
MTGTGDRILALSNLLPIRPVMHAVSGDRSDFQEGCHMQRSALGQRKRRSLAVLAFGGSLVIAGSSAAGCGQSASTRLSSADGAAAQKVSCPAVRPRVTNVPQSQRALVTQDLNLLDKQIAEANRRLRTSAGEGGPNFVQNAILGPLKDKRAAVLNRIAIDFMRAGQQPPELNSLAQCRLVGGGQQDGSGQQGKGGQSGDGQSGNGQAGSGVVGPAPDDFVDIRKVKPNRKRVRPSRRASRGSFVSKCGTDQEKHQNTDNIIISPGVPDGAQHLHDYVGNLSTTFASTDQSLAAAGTSCANRADKSTYFWPVLRTRTPGDLAKGYTAVDKNNVGTSVLPSQVILRYTGSPRGKVKPMPEFLRLFTGDAKAFSKGPANAKATWTCSGFTDRVVDKYPLCPSGSKLMRVFDEPSCWDGKNTDSANHRAHTAFPDAKGACPSGFKAIPHLTMTLVYSGIPNTAPKSADDVRFAVDGFATEQHKPDTDHAGYINVMSKGFNAKVAKCINGNRRC